ncbi:MAG: thioredoxin family protein [Blautia sp.]|nr:thioredoxin family protein [Blautia sp.]
MGLFGFGKKKEEEEKTPACCCNGACESYEAKSMDGACCGGTVDGIISIKVLGSGCKNCHALLESTKTAVKQMGLGIESEYVTDMEKIMGYGVMSMPALVVNEKVVSMGKVLKAADVEKLLHKLGY